MGSPYYPKVLSDESDDEGFSLTSEAKDVCFASLDLGFSLPSDEPDHGDSVSYFYIDWITFSSPTFGLGIVRFHDNIDSNYRTLEAHRPVYPYFVMLSLLHLIVSLYHIISLVFLHNTHSLFFYAFRFWYTSQRGMIEYYVYSTCLSIIPITTVKRPVPFLLRSTKLK